MDTSFAQVDGSRNIEHRAQLGADAVFFPPPGKMQAQPADPDLLTWSRTNIFNPAFNAVLVQPWNAISSSVNGIGKAAFDVEPLTRAKEFEVGEAKGVAWLSQNVSSGLGCALVYALAGRAARSVMRTGAEGFGLEAATVQRLSNPALGQIVGAVAYDGLREPRPGETRFGNAMSGLVAFTALETGNPWALAGSGLSGLTRRAMVGSIAGTLQVGTSTLVSQGQLPSWQQVESAALSGASMNSILPVLQQIGRSEKVETSGLLRSAQTERLSASGGLSEAMLTQQELVAPTARPANLNETAKGETRMETVERVSGTPDHYVGGTETKQILAGIEGAKSDFQTYAEYVGRNHGFIELPYKILKVSDVPNLEIHYPDKAASYARLTEPQIVDAVQSVPDARLLKNVTVVDYAHRDQAWLRNLVKEPSLTIFGETNLLREVTLYKPQDVTITNGTMNHEWWHVLRLSKPSEARLFDQVGQFEQPLLPFNRPNTSNQKSAELWADLGQALTSGPPEVAVMAAYSNPIRASILGKLLGKTLSDVPPLQRSAQHLRLQELVSFIGENVQPQAVKNLGLSSHYDTAAAGSILSLLESK